MHRSPSIVNAQEPYVHAYDDYQVGNIAKEAYVHAYDYCQVGNIAKYVYVHSYECGKIGLHTCLRIL